MLGSCVVPISSWERNEEHMVKNGSSVFSAALGHTKHAQKPKTRGSLYVSLVQKANNLYVFCTWNANNLCMHLMLGGLTIVHYSSFDYYKSVCPYQFSNKI